MKKYSAPTLETIAISNADILNGSDVIIDIGDLYDDKNIF